MPFFPANLFRKTTRPSISITVISVLAGTLVTETKWEAGLGNACMSAVPFVDIPFTTPGDRVAASAATMAIDDTLSFQPLSTRQPASAVSDKLRPVKLPSQHHIPLRPEATLIDEISSFLPPAA